MWLYGVAFSLSFWFFTLDFSLFIQVLPLMIAAFMSILYSVIKLRREQNPSVDIDLLKITKINVDKGPTMKRFMTRAKGRSNKILMPTSHILIELS